MICRTNEYEDSSNIVVDEDGGECYMVLDMDTTIPW